MMDCYKTTLVELYDGSDWFCGALKAYSELANIENELELMQMLESLSQNDPVFRIITVVLFEKSTLRLLRCISNGVKEGVGLAILDYLRQPTSAISLDDSNVHQIILEQKKYLAMAYGLSLRSEAWACLVAFPEPLQASWQSYLSVRLVTPHLLTVMSRIDICSQTKVRGSKKLSGREVEILSWVAKGKTNPEIGTILGVSAFTVKNHLSNIFSKLDVVNRAQAIDKAMAEGILAFHRVPSGIMHVR